ncbi:MAG: hypothetical protein DRR19_07065 [Candidatus Parabeggiatoa sp. nov. 1]|nr:MAG: hypothetical protein DRR19_07065 [Gammaproteobacteria bacterium]
MFFNTKKKCKPFELLAKPQVGTWGYSNSTPTGLPQVFLNSARQILKISTPKGFSGKSFCAQKLLPENVNSPR